MRRLFFSEIFKFSFSLLQVPQYQISPNHHIPKKQLQHYQLVESCKYGIRQQHSHFHPQNVERFQCNHRGSSQNSSPPVYSLCINVHLFVYSRWRGGVVTKLGINNKSRASPSRDTNSFTNGASTLSSYCVSQSRCFVSFSSAFLLIIMMYTNITFIRNTLLISR